MNPADNFARIHVGLLYPPLYRQLLLMVESLEEIAATFLATAGFRTSGDQAKLYFQGRTTPGKIVTNAPPFLSAHNYGLAVDFCRFFDEVPSWEVQDYEALGEAAQKVGLVWGGTFSTPDRPHVQWPKYVTAAQLEPLKEVFTAATDGPLQAVWSHVTAEADTGKITTPQGGNT